MADNLASQPPPTPSYILSYPLPHVLLVTINRPRGMNSLPYASHWEADELFQWFDREPELRVAVVTGSKPVDGRKEAFSAGQDLIEQGKLRQAEFSGAPTLPTPMQRHPPSGFMALSRRTGKKPVIAAVNGFALGGGFEICLGCDMIVASPQATFSLPEASRGLYAGAGGLARLVRLVGLPLASEIALTGRILSAKEAESLHVINHVSRTHETLLDEALALARKIGDLSPDAVIVSRYGLRIALEDGSVERAAQRTDLDYGIKLRDGENIRIGLMAFASKTKPAWVPSKL